MKRTSTNLTNKLDDCREDNKRTAMETREESRKLRLFVQDVQSQLGITMGKVGKFESLLKLKTKEIDLVKIDCVKEL